MSADRRYLDDVPWALLPSARAGVAAALAEGDTVARADADVGGVQGEVAVLPIHGVIFPRGDVMGGVGLDKLGRLVQALATDKRIGAIVLDVDSPGGSVAGVTEFASILRAARDVKPIVAVANHTMASAGYWIGAQATTVVASPSARVGSVGVYSMHTDISEALEREGVKQTLISAGEFKTEGNHLGPLDDDALAQIQATVDDAARMFHADLAAGRGVPVATVAEQFGAGRMFSAEDARSAGMVDRVATLDETINWLGYFSSPKSAATRRRYRAAERALRVGRP